MVENISIYHIHSDTYTYQLLPSDEITTDPQEKAITFTNRLYREILNREADAEGLAFWLAKLNDGTVSPDQLLGEFENSAEFKAVDKALKSE